MKYIKMLGLLAVAAAALMAFAGSASATITSPTGKAYTGEVQGTATNTHLTGTVKIACKHSLVVGETTGGATTGKVSTLTFGECNPDTVTVLENGFLTVSAGTGGVVSEGAKVTVVTHKTVFGIPITSHCIYATDPEKGTSVGTITDTHVTGGHAVIHINGNIPRVPTDGACGEDAAIWTGTYTVTKPAEVWVD